MIMIRKKAGAVALGVLPGAPRTDFLENAVWAKFGSAPVQTPQDPDAIGAPTLY